MGRTPDCPAGGPLLASFAARQPAEPPHASKGGHDGRRHDRRLPGASYEIAEAIAPTWERRRADIEEVSTPVGEWMLRELAPREGDTVLELAAGTGDTGFEAAAIVGEPGRLVTTDFSPSMLEGAGFSEVRTEEVPVRFVLPDADEYLSVIADTAGPVALALRGLPDAERTAIKAEVEDSFPRFAAECRYELPGVALCAAAS